LITIIEAAVPKVTVVPKANVPDGVSTKATDSYGVPWGAAVPKGVSMATAVSEGVTTVLEGVSMENFLTRSCIHGGLVPIGVSRVEAALPEDVSIYVFYL
jgi:hypothetical protein